jgi:hypothetical protein
MIHPQLGQRTTRQCVYYAGAVELDQSLSRSKAKDTGLITFRGNIPAVPGVENNFAHAKRSSRAERAERERKLP